MSQDEVPRNLPLPFGPEFEPRPGHARPRRIASARARYAVGAPGYVSVRRAAELLSIQPRSVRKAIERKRLTSQRLGRMHFIPAAEVERYRRIRLERKRLATARSERLHLD